MASVSTGASCSGDVIVPAAPNGRPGVTGTSTDNFSKLMSALSARGLRCGDLSPTPIAGLSPLSPAPCLFPSSIRCPTILPPMACPSPSPSPPRVHTPPSSFSTPHFETGLPTDVIDVLTEDAEAPPDLSCASFINASFRCACNRRLACACMHACMNLCMDGWIKVYETLTSCTGKRK